MFNQKNFNDFVLDNNVIGFYENAITLSSGRKSNWYADWRKIFNNVFLIEELSNHVISFAAEYNLEPDCFYGVPDGATKLGIITQFQYAGIILKGSPILPMGRKTSKKHGKSENKYFNGAPNGKVVILDDVTTTGTSLTNEIEKIVEIRGCSMIGAIGLIDRMEIVDKFPIIERDIKYSVKDLLAMMDVTYLSMSNAKELLPLAIELYKPNKNIIKAIEEEYSKYGIVPINLR